MKYIVVLGDGMADSPIDELNEQTPLEYANTPMMDELAQKSEIGQVHTIPAGMSPGSDTANLSVLGYDPKKILYGAFSAGGFEHRRSYERYRYCHPVQYRDSFR